MLIARTPEVFRARADVARVFSAAEAAHVTAIAVLVKEDEELDDIPSGRAFYASAIAPIATGYESFDVLAAAIEEGRTHHVEVIAWIPQFHDATAIERDPGWTMATLDASGSVVPYVGGDGERFASPANNGVRDYERSIVGEIAAGYAVDGIVIDWVRYDGWATGLEDATRVPYRDRFGVDPVTIDFTTEGAERERWRSYRAEIVASHVRDVRSEIDRARPGTPFGVFILSPDWVELSQDARLFAGAVDYVAPMSYFDDWGLPPSWVWETNVPATHARVGDGVGVVPTLDEDWTDAQNAEVLAGIGDSDPYVQRIAWFAYGDWSDALVARLGPLGICR